MDNESTELCHFCKSVTKKYTCPRCNADYCSLICFQSSTHLECSETFYQSCVLDSLSSSDDIDAKDKMIDVLKRFHDGNNDEDSLDSDDDVEGLSLADRLANVNLDDTKQVWDSLNNDERQEFEAFLRSGDVTKFIPKWQPWWTIKPAKIKEVGENCQDDCPKIKEDIREFASLTNKPPSECVQYNIANVISAYVFTARYFNGDYYDFVHEAVGCITHLALCLKDNKNFESVQEAVQSVQERSLTNDWISVDQENIAAMKDDAALILNDCISKNHCVLVALSDLHRLLTMSLNEEHGKGNNFMQNCPMYKVTKKDIRMYLKKVEYYLSYTLYVDCNKVVS